MNAPHISDKYEVLEQIGRGGMGVVYRARHRALQTMLAVKVLPPSWLSISNWSIVFIKKHG